MLLCTRSCSCAKDGLVPAAVRVFEKKRSFRPPLRSVEAAAGRPLIIVLWRVGTTGKLPFARRAFWNISRLTGCTVTRPWPNWLDGTVEIE